MEFRERKIELEFDLKIAAVHNYEYLFEKITVSILQQERMPICTLNPITKVPNLHQISCAIFDAHFFCFPFASSVKRRVL
mmetsp:Transcript_8467/g.12981  ORF Transcript_8467/g.12981 Transcript_8467/m.12981 type:complete len:80 (+) Transcript_8467:29-268(+)